MIRIFKKLSKRMTRRRSGAIFALVLIFLVLGAIVLTPLLTYMSTGLKANHVYDDKTSILYAADAGIEDGKWKIQYDKLPNTYSAYDFNAVYPYTISQGAEIGQNINQYPVDVNIRNVWIPANYIDLNAPGQIAPSKIVNDNKLTVVGSTVKTGIPVIVSGQSTSISQYRIKVVYTPGTEAADALKIDKIGVWLPRGFEYFSDSTQQYLGAPIRSQLEGLASPYQSVPGTPVASNGNQMVVWSYPSSAYPTFSAFPTSVLTSAGNTLTLELTFFFKPLTDPSAKPDAVAWIKTYGQAGAGVDDIPYSWNADVQIYKIQSTAEGFTAEAYTGKNQLRAMSSAVAGDYYATGNTLMIDAHSDNGYIRDTWLNNDHSSPAAVSASFSGQGIPDGVNPVDGTANSADISAAYLYWTGWKNYNSISNVFSENANDLNEWDISSSANQTRVPTADGDISGVWTPTNVSTDWISPTANAPDSGGNGNGFETNPTYAYADDNNRAVNVNNATPGDRHKYSGYDVTSVPAGSTITGISLRLDWYLDSTSGTNSIGAELSWNDGAAGGWTPARTDATESTSTSHSNILGNGADNWNHNWTVAELSHLVVRLTCNSTSNPTRTFNLDWVPVMITYAPPARYSVVDETTPDNSDYMTGTTDAGGNCLFSFSPFTVPVAADSPVTGLTIYYSAQDASSGTNNIRPSIKVGGTLYNAPGSESKDPGSSWTIYSYTYATNPKTGLAWTTADINGSGPNPLQQFGVYSTDLNPDIGVSMVYARADYGYDSLWTVNNGRFQGQGSGSANDLQKTITMKNTLDLSSYAPGTVKISWDQTENGNLAATDYLYYAFSGDGGISWSSNYAAFHDDSPASPFSTVIPSQFLTTDFKMRFYFTFDAATKYVYLDNIGVITELFSDDCVDFSSWTKSASGSRWTIDSGNGRFSGQGSSSASVDQRTLTLSSSLDLSPYSPGTVSLCWQQTVTNNLESNDLLYFAVSGNGGTTWSANIEAVRGSSTSSMFGWDIPSQYLTNNFKVRLYFNLNDTSEYVYIDNILIGIMAPDRSVDLKINGQQVYLDGAGQPAVGSQSIIADRTQIIPNITSDVFKGFSYSSTKDVTALVREYTKVDAGETTEHSPGIAAYSVGDVDATLGIDGGDYQLAHAGWSLILIYTSPQTVGHQLYLYDRFTYGDDYSDMDFDKDGNPGGDISGFVIPERIQNPDGTYEQNAAKITAFVGEGDDWIPGDFIAFNAPQDYWDSTPHPADIPNSYKLWDGITSTDSPGSNTASAPNNVWNGKSSVFSADGIDIDTFNIPWDRPGIAADQQLSQGDTTAHVDLYTVQDNWNLVYIIFSFRSKTTYGGSLSYLIH